MVIAMIFMVMAMIPCTKYTQKAGTKRKTVDTQPRSPTQKTKDVIETLPERWNYSSNTVFVKQLLIIQLSLLSHLVYHIVMQKFDFLGLFRVESKKR